MAIITRNKPDPIYVVSTACGRCSGRGFIPFLNPVTNAADESACPICYGTGTASSDCGSYYFNSPLSSGSTNLPSNRFYAGEVESFTTTRRRK